MYGRAELLHVERGARTVKQLFLCSIAAHDMVKVEFAFTAVCSSKEARDSTLLQTRCFSDEASLSTVGRPDANHNLHDGSVANCLTWTMMCG